MTRKTLQITTRSFDETQLLGEKIGSQLEAGTVLALTGDLGSGKTTFVQGLARGLAVPEGFYVTSPSYTMINEYPGRHRLFHIDLYRISGPESADDIGLYDILDGNGVVVIEWAERIKDDLPSSYLEICFKITGDETRDISMNSYGHVISDLIRKIE